MNAAHPDMRPHPPRRTARRRAAISRRVRGRAMRSSAARCASMARSPPSPARAFRHRSDIQIDDPARRLCLARGAEADRRPRPFPASIRAAARRSTSAPRPAASRRCCWSAAPRTSPPSMSATARSTPALAGRSARHVDRGAQRARSRRRPTLAAGRPDFLVCDVSFISLRLALPPALALAAPGAKARPAGQAAIRGRPRGDRQGRPAARSRRRRRASPKSCAPGSTHVPAGARSASARRRSRAATATANSCSPGSRTGERRASTSRGSARRATASPRPRRGPVFVPFTLPGEVVTAARRARPRRADRGRASRRRSASSPPAGISAPAAAARSSIWSRRLSRLEARQGGSGACAAAASRRRSATSSPARRRRAAARRSSARRTEARHAARLQQALSDEIVDDRGMPDPAAGDRRRARPAARSLPALICCDAAAPSA